MKILILKNFIYKNKHLLLIGSLLITVVTYSAIEEEVQPSPKEIVYNNEIQETDLIYNIKRDDISLLDNYRLAKNSELEKELEILRDRLKKIEEAKDPNYIENLTNSAKNGMGSILDSIAQKEEMEKGEAPIHNKSSSIQKKTRKLNNSSNTITVNFPVSYEKPAFTQAIPKGSYMRAIMLNGVESKSGGLEPVLLSIEGKTIMPNNFHANLKNCVALGKAQGEESNERVCIQIHDVVCLDKNGKSIERKVNGFITDNRDNTNCAIGKINTKQNEALYSSAIANIIKSASDIIASSATSTITTPLGGVIEATKSQKDKIIASGVSGGANTLADWYLKRANTLMPTINIGSGREVWIVTLDSFEIPKSFLKE